MNELTALIILSQVPQLGNVKLKLLLDYFGSALAALNATASEIEQLPGFGTKIAQNWGQWDAINDWEEELDLANKHHIKIVSYKCPDYPKRLLELSDSPLLLYIKGELKAQDSRSIAVVGTRNATRYGLFMTEKISRELSSHGFTIVSGLARGVDTKAHESALLAKGRTIAVIGSGLLDIYPKENKYLAEKICDNGALISEYSLKTPPHKHNFPKRNRIVSGMTLGTALMEAPIDSGAMITMNNALSQKRHLFAIPGQADDSSFEGNHHLIKQKLAHLVENGQDIAAHFEGLFGSLKLQAPKKEILQFDSDEEKLLASLPQRELSFDEIAGISNLVTTKLNVLLMSLILKRAIKEYPGKIYKKVY